MVKKRVYRFAISLDDPDEGQERVTWFADLDSLFASDLFKNLEGCDTILRSEQNERFNQILVDYTEEAARIYYRDWMGEPDLYNGGFDGFPDLFISSYGEGYLMDEYRQWRDHNEEGEPCPTGEMSDYEERQQWLSDYYASVL